MRSTRASGREPDVAIINVAAAHWLKGIGPRYEDHHSKATAQNQQHGSRIPWSSPDPPLPTDRIYLLMYSSAVVCLWLAGSDS